MTICYCGNHLPFQECCQPFIDGLAEAPTAEALMRSRYSAYATGAADYLIDTTHSSTRKLHKKKDILAWSLCNHWCYLNVLEITPTTVTFEAHYLDNHKKEQTLHEKSTFIFENESWFYVDGEY